MDYRREVDGLRALALVPVMFYHAGFQTFSGGFVGVDIFFVISGYLITSIILSELQAGTFKIINFYERRARRILPALFVVMFACLPIAWFWLLPQDMTNFAHSLVAVSTFASNILFWDTSGYFDPAAELSPLLHTWSLAVEEQFYVFFPLFLILAWRLGKRWMLAILVAVTVLSLAAAQWGSVAMPGATFYLLPTRAWELLVGALVAFYLSGERRTSASTAARQAGAALGLLLLGCAVFVFNKRTPFPGLYALVPTIGTALIIMYATSETVVGKLLGHKVLVGLGLISYSAYLWHQPLFAFARHASLEEPGRLVLGSLAVAALVLACFSWKYVEAPFRSRSRVARRHVFLYGAIGSIFFVMTGLVGSMTGGFAGRSSLNAFDPVIARNEACSYPTEGYASIFCASEVLRAEKQTIVFVGDSLLAASMPGIRSASSALGIPVNFAMRWGCPGVMNVTGITNKRPNAGCGVFNKEAFRLIADSGVTHVVLFSAFNRYLRDGGVGFIDDNICDAKECSAEFSVAIQDTIRFLKSNNIQVWVVRQPPDFSRVGVSSVSKWHFLGGGTISMPRDMYDADSANFLRLVGSSANVVSFADLLCAQGVCRPYLGGHPIYSDEEHFGRKGATSLSAFWQGLLLKMTSGDGAHTGPGRGMPVTFPDRGWTGFRRAPWR